MFLVKGETFSMNLWCKPTSVVKFVRKYQEHLKNGLVAGIIFLFLPYAFVFLLPSLPSFFLKKTCFCFTIALKCERDKGFEVEVRQSIPFSNTQIIKENSEGTIHLILIKPSYWCRLKTGQLMYFSILLSG